MPRAVFIFVWDDFRRIPAFILHCLLGISIFNFIVYAKTAETVKIGDSGEFLSHLNSDQPYMATINGTGMVEWPNLESYIL
jgi:hypothetical protein